MNALLSTTALVSDEPVEATTAEGAKAELPLSTRIDYFNHAANAAKVKEHLIAVLIENPEFVKELREDFMAGHVAYKCVSPKAGTIPERRKLALAILAKRNFKKDAVDAEGNVPVDMRTEKEQAAYNSGKTAFSTIVRAADVKPADTRGGDTSGSRGGKEGDVTDGQRAPFEPVVPSLSNAAEVYGYFAIQAKAMEAVLRKHGSIALDVRLANIVRDLGARVAEIMADPSKVDPGH